MFEKFEHIGVKVTDLDRAVAFYTKALGMREREQRNLGAIDVAFVVLGDVALELICGSTDEIGARGPIDHIAFEVDDIEAAMAQVREAAPDITIGPAREWPNGSKTVIFPDPDGARLQFLQPAR